MIQMGMSDSQWYHLNICLIIDGRLCLSHYKLIRHGHHAKLLSIFYIFDVKIQSTLYNGVLYEPLIIFDKHNAIINSLYTFSTNI